MRIAILGAAGKIGRLTVLRALAEGHEVTAVARNAQRLEALASDSRSMLRLVDADLRDRDALARALTDQDVVLATFGAPLNLSTILHVPDICMVATQNVLDVMRKIGLRRLLAVSAIGVGDSRGHGRFVFRHLIQPLLLNRIFEDREQQEKLLVSSDLNWTIVRPAELTDEPASGNYQALLDLHGQQITTVSRADVADFLVRQASREEFLRRTPLLCRDLRGLKAQ